jgi:signal transduction histidine kinase
LPDRDSDIVGLSFEAALGPVAEPSAPDARPRAARRGQRAGVHRTGLRPPHPHGVHPRSDRPGEPINGVYLLSTDVTEEAQARAALAQTHKRELAAQLTSGLAHDFANLLTIILGLQGKLEKMPCPKAPRS